MAITNNGVRNLLPAAQLPDDYEKPDVTAFSDFEYKRTMKLSVAKATVEDSDPATTIGNIIGNATVGLKKQVDDILAADYLSTAAVTAYADLVSLGNNLQSMDKDSPALTDTAAAYEATVVLYVKTA